MCDCECWGLQSRARLVRLRVLCCTRGAASFWHEHGFAGIMRYVLAACGLQASAIVGRKEESIFLVPSMTRVRLFSGFGRALRCRPRRFGIACSSMSRDGTPTEASPILGTTHARAGMWIVCCTCNDNATSRALKPVPASREAARVKTNYQWHNLVSLAAKIEMDMDYSEAVNPYGKRF